MIAPCLPFHRCKHFRCHNLKTGSNGHILTRLNTLVMAGLNGGIIFDFTWSYFNRVKLTRYSRVKWGQAVRPSNLKVWRLFNQGLIL